MDFGLTTGKFYPFTEGHEYMLKFAANMVDVLYVVVSGHESDPIPLSLRVEAIRNTFGDDVVVIAHEDDIGNDSEVDEHGTILDDTLMDKWVDLFRSVIAPNKESNWFFITSEMYGKVVAEKLNINWVPVDIERETYPVSGTLVRSNFNAHFHLIATEMQKLLSKVIVVVGAESTGKSTLVKILEQHFNKRTTVKAVPEYGRAVSEAKNNKLTPEDFNVIAAGQVVNVRLATTNRLVISDTDLFTTYLFSDIYLDKPMQNLKDLAINYNIFDHYIVLSSNTDWVDDGTRVLPEQEKRIAFTNKLLEHLQETERPYTFITESSWDDRTVAAIKAVEKILSQ
jgi:NadR type nicotinamide-nucleotide adenylyltransferase